MIHGLLSGNTNKPDQIINFHENKLITHSNFMLFKWVVNAQLLSSFPDYSKAGFYEITIRATVLNEGTNTPCYGVITFESISSAKPLLFGEYAIDMKQARSNEIKNNSEQTL